MTQRKLLHESGTLAKGASGSDTYRVCLITEGEGSSGIYGRELLEQYGSAFNDSLSFMNHPLDPSKPHLRPAEDIAGRLVSPVVVEEHDGVMGLWSDFKPNHTNPQRAAFIAEYADALGLSIFIGADGHVDESGKFVVESFDGNDPYKSVDIVVAAGRGGHFARAAEAYKALETSAPAGPKPGATSAQDSQQEEGHMDEKVLEALNSLTALLTTFITESKAAAEKQALAEADAEAIEAAKKDAVTAAVDSYDEKIAAIDAVEGLLPSQVTQLRSDAKAGVDIAPAIESAKALVAEFKTLTEGDDDATGGRILGEGAKGDASAAAGRAW